MDLLDRFSPVLVVALVIVVLVRRLRGEPLDLKDTLTAPAILLFLGVRSLGEVSPTGVDVAWLVVLSVVGLLFGAARSATTVIERRDGRLVQRYRWRTLGIMVASLVVGAGLSLLAQRWGMHAQARPITLTIGVGLLGEAAITLLRASRLPGAPAGTGDGQSVTGPERSAWPTTPRT